MKPDGNTAGVSGPPGRDGSSSSVSAPDALHSGDCYAAGNRRRAVNRDETRRLLASGLPACPHCQPDIDLRIVD
ncbi:DUF6233 domain-containing protein [Streptomyces collinus]